MAIGRPNPKASRPILGVMGRPISYKCYGLIDPVDNIGRPKYFSTHLEKIRQKIEKTYLLSISYLQIKRVR